MKDELFIKYNGEYEALDLNETITLKYESNLFKSLDEFTNSSSYTISVPRTARNRRLLSGCDIGNTLNRVPYVKQVAQMRRDGVILVDGADLAIMRVTEDAFELNLFWGAATITENDYTLQDLNLGSMEFARNEGEFTYPYKCKINEGQNDESKILPTYPCYELFLKCCEKVGIELYLDDGITSGLPDKEKARFDGLVMPFLAANDTIEKIKPITSRFLAPGASCVSFFYLYGGSFSGLRFKKPEAEDYTTLYPARYDIRVRLQGNFSITIPTTCKADLSQLQVRVVVANGGISQGVLKEYGFNSSTAVDGGTLYYFNFDADDEFSKTFRSVVKESYNEKYISSCSVMIQLRPYPGGTNLKDFFDTVQTMTVGVTSMRIECKIDRLLPNEGLTFNYAENMPDMSCMDYISAMCFITGLSMVPKEGKFYPRAYSTMLEYASSISELTTNIITREDVSSDIKQIEFHNDDFAKKNYFRYDDNDDRNWDSFLPCNDWTLDDETDIIKLPFKTYKTVNNIAYVELYSYDDDDSDDETFEDKSSDTIFCPTKTMKVDGKTQYYCAPGIQWSTILNNYYQEYAAIINPFRMYTVRVHLNAARLAMIDLSKPIYFEKYGMFFFIRSITTGADDECEFELIKIRFTDETV